MSPTITISHTHIFSGQNDLMRINSYGFSWRILTTHFVAKRNFQAIIDSNVNNRFNYEEKEAKFLLLLFFIGCFLCFISLYSKFHIWNCKKRWLYFRLTHFKLVMVMNRIVMFNWYDCRTDLFVWCFLFI